MTTTFEHDSTGRVWAFTGGRKDGPLTLVEAHDRHGLGLLDCSACAAGEPMVHAFESLTEAAANRRTHFVVQSTHDFVPSSDPSNPYCQRSGPQGVCNLAPANRHHTAVVRRS